MGAFQISRTGKITRVLKRSPLKALHLEPIARSVADAFLSNFEILGNVGLGVWHWGLRCEGELLSVVTFGTTCFGGRRGWMATLAFNHGMKVIQLCRGGTSPVAPKCSASRTISLALRAMRETHGPFLAVAYANEELGEIGTIYQAAGAVYTGLTRPKGQASYFLGGKLQTAWTVRRQHGTRDRTRLRAIEPTVQVVPLRPKHRYVFVSAARIQKQRVLVDLNAHAQAYPRRS